ncbi:uncharacterized protein [Haliotis asinina]|uniref:uncharacterized protein n=1 Tax=Haliotis asinina TaxID=109174 RepID=UPI003531964E
MTHAQTLDLGLPGVDLPNIALNKPTKQSSDYRPSMTSDRAVDGNHNTNIVRDCAHVAVYNEPSLDWWQVDLRQTFLVQTVSITNRGDACNDRLTNFTVEVHTSDPTISNNSGLQLCYWHEDTVGKGLTVDLTCAVNTIGRYVRIVKYSSGHRPLTLCEVEVRGTPLHRTCEGMNLPNIALHKPTKQNSNDDWSKSSDRAVDGNHNTNAEVRNVELNNKTSMDWWQVDLRQTFLVQIVSITNRWECCHDRLTNFTVEVHTSDPMTSNNSGIQLCYWHKDTVGRGLTVDLPCAVNTIGRYVRIVKYSRGNKPLTLCEVDVKGTLWHKACGDFLSNRNRKKGSPLPCVRMQPAQSKSSHL